MPPTPLTISAPTRTPSRPPDPSGDTPRRDIPLTDDDIIISCLLNPELSWEQLADDYGIHLRQVRECLARPEIVERMKQIESAFTLRTRLLALKELSTVVLSLSQITMLCFQDISDEHSRPTDITRRINARLSAIAQLQRMARGDLPSRSAHPPKPAALRAPTTSPAPRPRPSRTLEPQAHLKGKWAGFTFEDKAPATPQPTQPTAAAQHPQPATPAAPAPERPIAPARESSRSPSPTQTSPPQHGAPAHPAPAESRQPTPPPGPAAPPRAPSAKPSQPQAPAAHHPGSSEPSITRAQPAPTPRARDRPPAPAAP